MEKKFTTINNICNNNNKTYADITNINARNENSISDQNKAIINLTSEIDSLKSQIKNLEKENSKLRENLQNPKLNHMTESLLIEKVNNLEKTITPMTNNISTEELMCSLYFFLQYTLSKTEKNSANNLKYSIDVVHKTTKKTIDKDILGTLLTRGNESLNFQNANFSHLNTP